MTDVNTAARGAPPGKDLISLALDVLTGSWSAKEIAATKRWVRYTAASGWAPGAIRVLSSITVPLTLTVYHAWTESCFPVPPRWGSLTIDERQLLAELLREEMKYARPRPCGWDEHRSSERRQMKRETRYEIVHRSDRRATPPYAGPQDAAIATHQDAERQRLRNPDQERADNIMYEWQGRVQDTCVELDDVWTPEKAAFGRDIARRLAARDGSIGLEVQHALGHELGLDPEVVKLASADMIKSAESILLDVDYWNPQAETARRRALAAHIEDMGSKVFVWCWDLGDLIADAPDAIEKAAAIEQLLIHRDPDLVAKARVIVGHDIPDLLIGALTDADEAAIDRSAGMLWPDDSADVGVPPTAEKFTASVASVPTPVETPGGRANGATSPRFPGETFAEFVKRRADELGVELSRSTPSPAAPTTSPPSFEFPADLVPDISTGRSVQQCEMDAVIDGIDIVDAYNRWCAKMVADPKGKTESIMVSCPMPGHEDRTPSAWLGYPPEAPQGLGNCPLCGGFDKYDIAAVKFGFDVPGYKTTAFRKLREHMAKDLGYVANTIGNPVRSKTMVSPTTVAAAALVTPGCAADHERVRGSIWATPLDLVQLASDTSVPPWLIEDFLLVGGQAHVSAPAKTGKSLVGLWIAAMLAIGKDPFTWEPREPARVLYLDFEMSGADLRTRLFDGAMNFDPAALMTNLFYFLRPAVGPLDTADGGHAISEAIKVIAPELIVVDTMSRVTEGPENDSDTYRAFYRHTGQIIKDAGVALVRFDHEGHGSTGRSRGSSAKADDVDVIWSISRIDGGLKMTNKGDRTGQAMDVMELFRTATPPLGFRRKDRTTWSTKAIAKARELDAAGVDPAASRRTAIDALKAAGIKPGDETVVTEAQKYRRATASTALPVGLEDF